MPGDRLETRTGRRYLVTQSRIVKARSLPPGVAARLALVCVVMGPEDDHAGLAFDLTWNARGRKP